MAHAVSTEIENIPFIGSAGLAAAQDMLSMVDSPSVDASLKDGYAVISADISDASQSNPIKLVLVDHVAAGGHSRHLLRSGETIRILTGAPLPEGAQAVLTEEFTSCDDGFIYACADARPGRNIS